MRVVWRTRSIFCSARSKEQQKKIEAGTHAAYGMHCFFLYFCIVIFCFVSPAFLGIINASLAVACTEKAHGATNIIQQPVTEILLLHSFHSNHFWEKKLTTRIHAAVKQSALLLNCRIRMREEFLDAERYDAAALEQEFIRLFTEKYRHVALRAVVTVDDDALHFMLKNGQKLFPNVPVVFCGIASLPQSVGQRRNQYTGIVESFSIDKMLSVLPTLHPNAKTLAILCGDTTSAKIALAQVRGALFAHGERWNYRELVGLSPENLQKALKTLPQDTVIINFSYYRSPDGRNFSMDESMRMLTAWTDLPMYSPWGSQMGKGVVAGQSEFEGFHALEAAKMVQALLQGASPAELPILHEPLPQLLFDYGKMQKYGIEENLVPKDSKILYRPLSLYEQHKAILLPISAVIVVLCSIIAFLTYLLRVQQRSEALIIQEKEMLIRSHALKERSRLAHRMEAIGRMTSGITHDVNNILGGIAACTQLAILEVPPQNPAHEDLTRILQATTRGKSLMKRIRMTDGTQVQDGAYEECVFAKILDECMELLRPQIPSHILVQRQNAVPQAKIFAVTAEIHQIVYNLCLNAVQAMEQSGGCLRIDVQFAEDAPDTLCEAELQKMRASAVQYIKITVSDTGVGIPAALWESIFDPFFTTRQSAGGTGLGLAQVHSLLQRNKGFITLKSSERTGSCFTVFLPTV